MNLEIEILSDDGAKKVAHLKEYLERAKIAELESVAVNRTQTEDGQMAATGGVMTSVTALISSATGPLTELMKVLGKYVEGFRTELKLKNSAGDEIVLSTTKLDKKAIDQLVNAFMEKNNNTVSSNRMEKGEEKSEEVQDKQLPENEVKDTEKPEATSKKEQTKA